MQYNNRTYDRIPAPDWLDMMISYHTPRTYTDENLKTFGEILRRHKYHIRKQLKIGNTAAKTLDADELSVITANLFDTMLVYPRASKVHLAVKINNPMGIWYNVAQKRPVGTYTSSRRFIIRTLSTIAGRNVRMSELRRIIYLISPYIPTCQYEIPQNTPSNTLNHFDAFLIGFLDNHIADIANINKMHRLYSDWFTHHKLYDENKRFLPIIDFKERLKQSLEKEVWNYKRHYIEKVNTIPPDIKRRQRIRQVRKDTP